MRGGGGGGAVSCKAPLSFVTVVSGDPRVWRPLRWVGSTAIHPTRSIAPPPPTSPTALSCTHAQPAPPRKRQRQRFRTLISSMFHVACVDVVGVGVFVRSFAEVPCVLVLVLVVFCCFCLL